MTARKSTNWASVAPRTLTGPDACHSLKAAESLARGAHSLQALSALLGPSGAFWRVISAADRLGKNRSRAHSLPHKLARNSEPHLARNSELQLARNSELQLTAHGEPHKLERKGKGEELARKGKDCKLRDAVSVTNRTAKLATSKGQKCNDQNTLWEGRGMIRMPDTTRDADGSAPIDQFCLSFRLVENDSHSQEPLSSTNVLSRENDSHSQERGGKSSRGPDTPLAGS